MLILGDPRPFILSRLGFMFDCFRSALMGDSTVFRAIVFLLNAGTAICSERSEHRSEPTYG